MTSAELNLVVACWTAVRSAHANGDLLRRLTAALGGEPVRATWMIEAVDELVPLLSAPTLLGARARMLAEDPRAAGADPRFATDGRALLDTLSVTADTWNPTVERAWLSAWHLLAEEVALDHLSPFTRTSSEDPR